MTLNILNMRYLISLIVFISIYQCVNAQQWPINPGDNANYNVISAVFGEIHGTSYNGHFHEGIDLYVPAGCNVRAIENDAKIIDGNENGDDSYVDVRYGGANSCRKVRYYHVNYNIRYVKYKL